MTATTSKLGADMTKTQIESLIAKLRKLVPAQGEWTSLAESACGDAADALELLARQPVAIDKEADDDIEEAREILENMVRSIELDGNYSTEATCTFLRQALNCLPVAAPLTNEAGKPAPSWAPVINRNFLGQIVREAWVKWAKQQPNPKPSWLVPYDELSEADKEADRQIGEAVLQWVLSIKSATWEVSPSVEQDPRRRFSSAEKFDKWAAASEEESAPKSSQRLDSLRFLARSASRNLAEPSVEQDERGAFECRDLTDDDMDKLIVWLGEHDRDEIGHQGLCDRIIGAFARAASAATAPMQSAGDKEATS